MSTLLNRPLHVQVFGILLFCYSGILLNQLTFFDFYFWVVPIVWYILGIFLFDIISYFYALLHSFALLYYSINKKKIIELRKLTSHPLLLSGTQCVAGEGKYIFLFTVFVSCLVKSIAEIINYSVSLLKITDFVTHFSIPH